MNLLISGISGREKATAKITADCGYEKICFLDDNSQEFGWKDF